MIQGLVAFALHQRFITVALALLLTAGGIVSFYRLPIEAYPDVVDVEVDIRTIPGDSEDEVKRHLDKALGAFAAQISIDAALNDAEALHAAAFSRIFDVLLWN